MLQCLQCPLSIVPWLSYPALLTLWSLILQNLLHHIVQLGDLPALAPQLPTRTPQETPYSTCHLHPSATFQVDQRCSAILYMSSIHLQPSPDVIQHSLVSQCWPLAQHTIVIHQRCTPELSVLPSILLHHPALASSRSCHLVHQTPSSMALNHVPDHSTCHISSIHQRCLPELDLFPSSHYAAFLVRRCHW